MSTAGSVATRVLPSPVFISAISPLVQHHAADELDVEVALAERALGGLAHDREDLAAAPRRIASSRSLAIFDRADASPSIRRSCARSSSSLQLRDLGFEFVDLVNVGPQPLEFAFVLRAEDFARNEGKS